MGVTARLVTQWMSTGDNLMEMLVEHDS